MPVSAAAIWKVGRSAEGRRSEVSMAGAAAAGIVSTTVVAAPATATPATKLRRLTFGPLSLRAISSSLVTPLRGGDLIKTCAAAGISA